MEESKIVEINSRIRSGRVRNDLWKHGEANKTKANRAWRDARSRCNNRRHRVYARYGKRGIKMCERWNDYRMFLADMGAPKQDRSLDRLNVNLGYEPGNCYWATKDQQKNNRPGPAQQITQAPGKLGEVKLYFALRPTGKCLRCERPTFWNDTYCGRIECVPQEA